MATPAVEIATRELTYREALNEALHEEMDRDPKVFLMGEDIARFGGPLKVTEGLLEKYGPERVIDTPIAEAGFVGIGVGAALTGLRPVVEVMFCDFMFLASDQIANQASKIRYMLGGQARVPMVLRSHVGAGRGSAAQHSQSLEMIYAHLPGLIVVMPSTPHDAKGLLKTAIRSDDPIIFLENKLIYVVTGPVPEGEYTVPIGVADVKREGSDVTIVATSRQVHTSLAAAEKLAEEGIEVEIVDPRTIKPLDIETIVESVKKTQRVVVVNEGCRTGGFTSECAARIMDEAFDYLDAPIVRLSGNDTPIPAAKGLEAALIPQEEDVIAAVKGLV